MTVTTDSGTAIDACAVIAQALQSPSPTPNTILTALDSAGYTLMPPVPDAPAWMPSTPRSLQKVRQYAELAKAGNGLLEAAEVMRVSVRMAERYHAAANALGLFEEG